MTDELYEWARRAVQVVTASGQRLSAGRACLFVIERIGWHPRLARLGRRRPFIWPIELGYWLVARNRDLVGRFLFRQEDDSGSRL